MHHDVDGLTQQVANQASGARLAFRTGASTITFTYRATLDSSEDGLFESRPSTVTLTSPQDDVTFSHTNGNRRIWVGPKIDRVELGEDSVCEFTLSPSNEGRQVDIWLPHACEIEIIDISADAELFAALSEKPKWVHYGSSISHSGEAEKPTGVWPVVAARLLNLELFSLGLAGSANLEQFAAKTIAGLDADLISLKLGINPVNGRNMTMRTFVPAVHAFLDTIREKHPNVPIMVISPVYCREHETLPGPTLFGSDGKIRGSEHSANEWIVDLTLERIRSKLEEIIERRRDENMFYLNGLELFSEAEFDLMPDGLHPNSEGYQLMGEKFANAVQSNAKLKTKIRFGGL
jgi:lysophospholipase L1-like esterase